MLHTVTGVCFVIIILLCDEGAFLVVWPSLFYIVVANLDEGP